MVTKHALELPAACLVAYCTVGAAALHVLFSIFPHFLSLSPWSLPPWACTSQIKPRHCQSCLGSILTASHQGLSMLYCGTAEALLTHLLLTFSWSIQWFSFLLSTILWMLIASTLLAAVSWTLLHFHLSCVLYISTWVGCFQESHHIFSNSVYFLQLCVHIVHLQRLHNAMKCYLKQYVMDVKIIRRAVSMKI